MKNRVDYIPIPAKVVALRDETLDVLTLQIKPDEKVTFRPGQFFLLSVFNAGESAFAFSNDSGDIECSVKCCGLNTQAIHRLAIGDFVGVRGPYGNSFLDFIKGKKDIYLVAGGIGTAPIRSLLQHILANRNKFGKVTLLMGARTPADLPYMDELMALRKNKKAKVDVILTVDTQPEEGWKENVGFVPVILDKIKPKTKNSLVFVCGPPIMIKFCADTLSKKGFKGDQIISTLENRMQCGIGKCGRCNIGPVYVCKCGPVFTYDDIKKMPKDM